MRGKGELLFNGYRVFVWDDKNVLETDGGDGRLLYNNVNVLNVAEL